MDGIKGDKGDVGLQGLRGIQVELNIIKLFYLQFAFFWLIYFVFGFLLQGDKGQPGLPGDQGGKGVSGVYLGALGVQAQLEKRLDLNNQLSMMRKLRGLLVSQVFQGLKGPLGFQEGMATEVHQDLQDTVGTQDLRGRGAERASLRHVMEDYLGPLDSKGRLFGIQVSDSLTEGTAEWGQRKKRRVFGTDPTGKWPRLIHLSALIFFFHIIPPVCSIWCFYNL
ncbi:unnamed protein product [Tetraodon nigroviridis]|uniref:(spotted green pufferfish) hypothetical protein n=1 Tax=Tetraodon nigroviridis TaxID=99883 RepID=Q4RWF6_TETNG|nr:unnamed protein product [Tetraodon nigroviridis]